MAVLTKSNSAVIRSMALKILLMAVVAVGILMTSKLQPPDMDFQNFYSCLVALISGLLVLVF